MKKQKWLILSHAFNMDGRAASQTITDKIPYLIEAGIEPVVISAVTGRQDTDIEHHQVLPWGPSALRFDLRHYLRQFWGKDWRYRIVMFFISLGVLPFMVIEKLLLGFQNHWSWSLAAYFKARRLMEKHQFDVLYTTAGVYSANLAGLWLKRKTGIRWIVEIHDPLVLRYSEDDIGLSPRKTRDETFQRWLEKTMCKETDLIWWFTQGALDLVRKRNPDLGDKAFWVLPGALPPESDAGYQRGDKLRLCHFGSLSSGRSLNRLLQALIAIRQQNAKALPLLELHIYGSDLDPEAKTLKENPLLAGLFVEHGRLEKDPLTGKSGRQRVVDEMHKADVLLLLHGEHLGCCEYVPSKLYEYMYTTRPILALVHDNPQLEDLVRGHGGYVAGAIAIEDIAVQVKKMYDNWAADALVDARNDGPSVRECVQTIVAKL